jgi:hypothetical protein
LFRIGAVYLRLADLQSFSHQKITMKKHQILSSAVLAGATFLTLVPAVKAAPISAWTFENDAVGMNNSPAPSTGTGTASSIGMNIYPTPNVGVTTDDVLLGKSSDTGTNTVADTTNIWRIRAQAGANGPANGWSSLAPIGTQGGVFAASTVGFTGINVSFDWYTTTQGEANLQLEYTTDGTTFTNVPITLGGSDAGLVAKTNTTSANTVMGSYVSDNLAVNGSPAGQDWFTGLTASITDPLAANNPNFAIEMVNASTGADDVSTQGTALNNSSGNWRFDNVSINGTSTVPEPATGAAILGGLGLLLGFGKVRRGSRKA